MYKAPSATTTAATLCLIVASSTAMAGETLVIDEDLDTLPTGYQLLSGASANATADIQIGNIGGSNGLIFDGSWDVPANGEEFAVGALSPIVVTLDDLLLDPREIGGIVSVRWTLDAEVISDTMVAPEQGIFAQLFVLQEQADGFVVSFGETGGNFVQVGDSVALDVTLGEADFGAPGARPDFSPMGRRLSFALQLGAQYPRDTTPDAFFVDGRMTADNWTVTVTDGADVFKNGFEPAPAGTRAQHLAGDEDCMCPTLPPSVLNQ